MSDWLEQAKELFGEDLEEKAEKIAQIQIAEGGRIDLPDIGEELLVYITRDPITVESEGLKQRGIEKALFARCRKVIEEKNGTVELSKVEYDLPISKTMAITALASLKRHGITDKHLEGRVFLITAREWKNAPEEYKKDKGIVKTYVMAFKPELTEKARKFVEAEEKVLEEEISL